MFSWIKGYALKHGLTFSAVVRLAITKFIESEMGRMSKAEGLLDIVDQQRRAFERVLLQLHIHKVTLQEQKAAKPEQEIFVKNERQQLYDQTLAMMHTLLEIAQSREASQNPQVKIQAILAANALTRTAEAIMRDYERGIAESHLKQMRDYIEQLRQAVQGSDQASRTATSPTS